jgi:ribosomal protein S18 acetylase RimI-like enzyme
MPALAKQPMPDIRLRPGAPADVDALGQLENRVFSYDRLSRRGFRRFLASATASLIVAECDGGCAGYALVLFRAESRIARLYSIAVEPAVSGRGIGSLLLSAAENAARERGATVLRLEVHERNAPAISRYRRSGYVLFGHRIGYYDDRGNALRFEKALATSSAGAKNFASPCGRPE